MSDTQELMRIYLHRWSLRLDGEPINGNNAIVQPVRTDEGTPAMLRLASRAPVPEHDWLALSLWDGDGAVRLYEHDSDGSVQLLERLDHTRNLDALPIDDAVIVAVACVPGCPARHRLAYGR